MRTVRSKSTRNALYQYSGGKCQWCGKQIDRLEIDHIIPYSLTRRTDIQELQALCESCNRLKGSKVTVHPRTHQSKLLRIADQILLGEKPDLIRIYSIVVPGGGKSALPIILYSKLAGRYINKICWVVPRENLARQAEDSFLDQDWRVLLRHDHRIRAATNEVDPCRGLSGYVTTYQALAADSSRINLTEFMRYQKMLLVLDEFHHVAEESEFERAIKPLAEQARLCLLMSGDTERGDGKHVSFMPYKRVMGVGWQPQFENDEEQSVITYSRTDALDEQAIIPLHFEHIDGATKYINRAGQEEAVDSIAELEAPTAAIFSALSTGYAHDLLHKAVTHWREYRQSHPRAKLLVVAPKIQLAKSYLKHLREQLHIPKERSGIATSEDSADARIAIERFKKHDNAALDVLVTVAMAYEGMDAPSITHIACLTHIRSKPWIHQMLARAVRVDRLAGAYHTQTAFVFSPDDQLFLKCIEEIVADQAPIVKDRMPREERDARDGGSTPAEIVPIISEATRSRAQDLTDGTMVDYSETARIQAAMEQARIGGVSTIQFHQALQRYQAQESSADQQRPTIEVRPSDEERQLRKTIENYTRQWERRKGMAWGFVNGQIVRQFRKSRDAMTIGELKGVWQWLQKNYSLEA